jgi:predicted PurR-regulated permease PerM
MSTAKQEVPLDGKAIALSSLIRASMYACVAMLALLVVSATEVLLAVFGGVLLAVLFHSIASWLHRKTGLGERYALALTILLLVAAVGLGIWVMAPVVSAQASQLADRLPGAIGQLKQRLMGFDGVAGLVENADRLRALLPGATKQSQYVANFFSSSLGALGNVAFVLFVGLFLAIDPGLYIRGTLLLVPARRRARTHEVLTRTGAALHGWLVAKLIAMAVIGILTTVGLYLLDIDLAIILGIIAALLSFVPNFGPIASAVPAVLLALVAGPDKVFYVLLLYAAIQAVESYGLTPFLQKRILDMPPALLLTMQVLLGVLAGILGVIFATPLTAAAMVMVRMWYVEDMLGNRGEDGAGVEGAG